MKKSLVLAMAMALGVTASAYAANPFSDVPAGHWAYDAVDKLVAAGVVDGMGDGTFQGNKTMTRYEMAQVTAKAMAKGANVDKLAAEFADELDNLGVRVAKLEKSADNVKITGQIRYHYAKHNKPTTRENDLRTRLTLKGQVNENWTYTALIQNVEYFNEAGVDAGSEKTEFQRAFVNGRVGGLMVTAGRYNMGDITGGNIHSHRFNGIEASYGKKIKVTVGGGHAAGSTAGKAEQTLYAAAETKIGVVGVHGGYYDFQGALKKGVEKATDMKIATAGVVVPMSKSLVLNGDYMRGAKIATQNTADGVTTKAENDKDGYVVALSYKGAKAAKVGSYGLFAKYYDLGNAVVVAHEQDPLCDSVNGFKGWKVGGTYAVAKNMVAKVEYADFDAKDTKETKMKTLWSELTLTF